LAANVYENLGDLQYGIHEGNAVANGTAECLHSLNKLLIPVELPVPIEPYALQHVPGMIEPFDHQHVHDMRSSRKRPFDGV
jgi:hypothetical protein